LSIHSKRKGEKKRRGGGEEGKNRVKL
jgi:hypothetical protein